MNSSPRIRPGAVFICSLADERRNSADKSEFLSEPQALKPESISHFFDGSNSL
jgi:hypothetical protein